MRRRPSGSGEDEDGSRSPQLSGRSSRSSFERTENSRARTAAVTVERAAEGSGHEKVAMRDTSRARQSMRLQERRHGKDVTTAGVSSADGGSMSTRWNGRTSMQSLTRDQNPLSHADMSGKQDPDDTHRKQAARLRSPWRCSLLTLATSFTAVFLLVTIMHSFLTRQRDPKGCAMSYMAPAFAHFSDFDTEHTRFASKYSLYLYREGGVDHDARVKGIPVLFIPGNAGSYKQVRPIGGEAARYFHDVLRNDGEAIAAGKRPLDIFTVDFNEELIAFHGQTLLDQAEYLNEAVAYILALYHNPQRSLREPGLPDPKSVIILGHSMGGVVARAMLRMPNYRDHSINTIITLSAPHARPPVSFDATMVETYHDLNTFWRNSYLGLPNGKNPLADVTLVSVAGGGLDTMIPSEYTSLTSLVPDTHGFTVFTSSIPNVWTGMDHLAIMWCDQFRKALVRALFDVVDVRRPAQTRAQSERIRAFRKRLLTGMEPVVEKALLDHEPTSYIALDHSSTTIIPSGERLVLHSIKGDASARAHVMPIPEQPQAEGSKFTLLTDQALNAARDHSTLSVLLCNIFPRPASISVLSYAIHLGGDDTMGANRLACRSAASDVSLLPASTAASVNAFDDARPFSYLQYDLPNIAEYQFVAVVETAPEPTAGWVIAEFSNASESSIKVSRGHHELLMRGLIAELPAKRPMMTEVKIPEIHSTLFAYDLEIRRAQCGGSARESFAPLLRQYIAEPYESKFIVNARGGNINVHGLSPYMPPPLNGGGATDGLSLQLWTDPTCEATVEISLKVDLLGSAGKLVMRYRTVFASFPLLVVALVLRKQFKVYDSTGIFMSFTQSMDQCIRTSLPAIFLALTFFAIAVSKSGHPVLNLNFLSAPHQPSAHATDFAANDLILGSSDPFFWFLVPLFAIISVGICIAMNYATLIITHLMSVIYSRVRTWLDRTTTSAPPGLAGNTSTRNRRIVTTGLLVLLVITVIPYQLAYVINCIVQITTCVRALSLARDLQSHQSYNFYNYTHSMLILMLWILPINMPVLLVWIRNLTVQWLTPFSTHHNLLSVVGYILLVEIMSTNTMIPRAANRTRYLTNTFIFALALYAAIYGVTYAYRMHYLVNALCLWLFVIHLAHDPAAMGTSPLASLAAYLGSSPPSSSDPNPTSARTSTAGAVGSAGSPSLAGRHLKKDP